MHTHTGWDQNRKEKKTNDNKTKPGTGDARNTKHRKLKAGSERIKGLPLTDLLKYRDQWIYTSGEAREEALETIEERVESNSPTHGVKKRNLLWFFTSSKRFFNLMPRHHLAFRSNSPSIVSRAVHYLHIVC